MSLIGITLHDCRGRQTSGNNARMILKHGTIDFFLGLFLHKNREENEGNEETEE